MGTTTLYLVRHAEPVSAFSWPGAGRERPLSPQGETQATGLVHRLTDAEIGQIRTSPLARCRATVEPLAAARGLELAEHPELAVGRRFALPREAGAIVVCAHSDNIPAALEAAGISCHSCRQASIWRVVLDRTGAVLEYAYFEPDEEVR